MDNTEAMIEFFEENFNEKKCHDLCRQYKFIQRSTSKIKGHEFIKAMIIPSEGQSTDSLKGLGKRMEQFNPELSLSAQAICERINSPSSSTLMKAVFFEILDKVHQKILKSFPSFVKLEGFARILLQDSTQISLNEALEKHYKGTNRGNTCSKAQCKIDVIHDLSKGLVVDATIFRGNEPDQSHAGRIVDFAEKGDLVIRDLGYFSLEAFKAIAEKGAYFVSRLKACINIYLNKDDKNKLNLDEYLNLEENLNKNLIDIEIFLGIEKVPMRLVIYRQSEELTNQRLENANKHTKKKGEALSESKKLLLNFSMFITNAPQAMLSAEFIGTVYRLRWEIELIFKRWKSQLSIDYLKGTHKERIDCMIWARLCTVIIIDVFVAFLKKTTANLFNVELSEVKIIQYLMRGSGFCLAVSKNRLKKFLEQMIKDVCRTLLKDKRSRKTMRGRALCNEPYYQMQTTDDQLVA